MALFLKQIIMDFGYSNKRYNTVGTVEKPIVERDKIETPNTQIHACSLSRLGTHTSINSGIVKLVLWVLTSQRDVLKLKYFYQEKS